MFFKPARAHKKRKHDAPGGDARGTRFTAIIFRGLQEQPARSPLLAVADAFFMSMDPDAIDVVQVPADHRSVFDRYILDHSDYLTLLVPCQLYPQALVLLFFKPDLFIISGLLHLLGPVFQALAIGVIILLREIYDFHGIFPHVYSDAAAHGQL